MIYYSTGKSPYQKRKGVPCEPHPKTAESLVKKGYLVRSLDELNAVKQVEEHAEKQVDVADVLTEDAHPTNEHAEKPKRVPVEKKRQTKPKPKQKVKTKK